MFCFLWTLPSTTEDAENTYKAYCRDLNEKEIFKELRLLNKLRQNDNLFGKLSSLELLNKIHEKGLQTIHTSADLCRFKNLCKHTFFS